MGKRNSQQRLLMYVHASPSFVPSRPCLSAALPRADLAAAPLLPTSCPPRVFPVIPVSVRLLLRPRSSSGSSAPVFSLFTVPHWSSPAILPVE